jgi:hypothetical protein
MHVAIVRVGCAGSKHVLQSRMWLLFVLACGVGVRLLELRLVLACSAAEVQKHGQFHVGV